MYNLPYFKEKDAAVVKQFMRHHPFITLCGADAAGKPIATHIPVLIEERDNQLFLRGHIMRNTDHHKAFMENSQVLAIFAGPHTYVSASWYNNPQQGSTWNYMTVQAKGMVQFLDEAALLKLLHDLTAHFENNEDSPALFNHIPDDYIQRMTKAIVAIEIAVLEMDNVFKLSQNRDEPSYHNIIEKLQQNDEHARQIASEMLQRKTQLFGQKDT